MLNDLLVTHDSDYISFAAFLVQIGRRVPHRVPKASEAELRDPLSSILKRIQSAPETMEHRVLIRLLVGMAEEHVTCSFRKADAAALSPATLLLFSAFTDDFSGGRYNRSTIRSVLVMNGISTSTGTDTTLG
jgi:hypothetical protein